MHAFSYFLFNPISYHLILSYFFCWLLLFLDNSKQHHASLLQFNSYSHFVCVCVRATVIELLNEKKTLNSNKDFRIKFYGQHCCSSLYPNILFHLRSFLALTKLYICDIDSFDYKQSVCCRWRPKTERTRQKKGMKKKFLWKIKWHFQPRS